MKGDPHDLSSWQRQSFDGSTVIGRTTRGVDTTPTSPQTVKTSEDPLNNGISYEIRELCANCRVLDPNHDGGKRMRMTEFNFP